MTHRAVWLLEVGLVSNPVDPPLLAGAPVELGDFAPPTAILRGAPLQTALGREVVITAADPVYNVRSALLVHPSQNADADSAHTLTSVEARTAPTIASLPKEEFEALPPRPFPVPGIALGFALVRLGAGPNVSTERWVGLANLHFRVRLDYPACSPHSISLKKRVTSEAEAVIVPLPNLEAPDYVGGPGDRLTVVEAIAGIYGWSRALIILEVASRRVVERSDRYEFRWLQPMRLRAE